MKSFAHIYDEFMQEVNYDSWYKFLKMYLKKPGKLLDLGCGTGNLSKKFSNEKFVVTGIDKSKDMIDIAKNKDSLGKYQVIDMLEYSNQNHFDYVISCFDTINYLKNKKEFETLLQKTNENLEKNGFFIFDVVQNEIFEEIFETDLFVDSTENYTCIWYHEQVKKNRHRVSMEIFYKLENSLFEKIEEVEEKYIFEDEYIIKTVKKYGFEIYDTAKNEEFGKARTFYILKKIKDYQI